MTIVLSNTFRGPPASANGGYACGVAAELLGAAGAEVELRAPPPLDRELEVRRDDDRVELLDGGRAVAIARPWDGDVEVPAPVTIEEAEAATRRFDLERYADDHVFPTCFTCGPDRAHGDGLRIFPGRYHERDLVAWPWTPHDTVGADDGLVDTPVVWAALDCPSGFATSPEHEMMPVVLGRLAARVDRRPAVDEPTVLAAWFVGEDGRRRTAGVALYGASGDVMARGLATWVVLTPEQVAAFTGAQPDGSG